MAVAACITVHNPDVARLGSVVDALRDSVEAVVLFDNGGAEAFLMARGLNQCDGFQVIGSGENVGLSWALNCCCAKAAEMGMGRVLLMDQDSIPGPHMVEELTRGFNGRGNVAIVCPRIVKEGEDAAIADSKVDSSEEDVPRAITSGSLLSLDAWESVGGFDEDLFVDWVDYDFSASLRDAGYRLVRENGVFLEHQLGNASPVTLPVPVVGRDGVRLLRMLRTNHSEARRMDKARSWAISLAKGRSRAIRAQEVRYVFATVLRDLLVEKNKRGLVDAYARGFREGIAHVRGKEAQSC